MSIEFRKLARNEISLLRQIDRSETIDGIYYHKDGQLVLEKEHHDVSNEWWQSQRIEPVIIPELERLLDSGGVAFGAFDGKGFAGIVALGADQIGKEKDTLIMHFLHISQSYRGRGIGSTLVSMVKKTALERGAKRLYISSIPSKNSVSFYLNQGARVAETDEVEPNLFELEPEDIHMILPL